jgi:ABC-2 type transport system ATP-binding protein
LVKIYKNGHKAVNSNTFCVKKGEVLGLLGPNGAGKSSTFNIMTLGMKRSGGDCKIHSTNIDNINIKN